MNALWPPQAKSNRALARRRCRGVETAQVQQAALRTGHGLERRGRSISSQTEASGGYAPTAHRTPFHVADQALGKSAASLARAASAASRGISMTYLRASLDADSAARAMTSNQFGNCS